MDRFTGLSVFTQVADSGGFSAAARRLNMSTTMVSNHIQALENRLGALNASLETRLGFLDNSLDGRLKWLDESIDGRLKSLEQTFDTRASSVTHTIDGRLGMLATSLTEGAAQAMRDIIGHGFARLERAGTGGAKKKRKD